MLDTKDFAFVAGVMIALASASYWFGYFAGKGF